MKSKRHLLSDFQIKTAKPNENGKPLRLSDGGNLYVLVKSQTNKYWRYDYQYENKRKTLSLGTYPEISLTRARQIHVEAETLLSQGIDPTRHKQAKIARAAGADTFSYIAHDFVAKNAAIWSQSHTHTQKQRIDQFLIPALGTKTMDAIFPKDVLACIQTIEKRGTIETARRALGICRQVFHYAIAAGKADRDPTLGLTGALKKRTPTHFAAITDPTEFGDFLKVIHAYQGSYVVQSALKLAPLVFVRPSELRTAKWADINFETGEWRYMVNKTKTPHIVPLARQALKILTDLHALTGNSEYVFPSIRTNARPMSDNALLAAMRRMDIPKEIMCGHGFRASARTILDENLGVKIELIEHQLAHNVKDALGRAYNRTKHLDARREMMQTWADYLDNLTTPIPKTEFKVVARKKGFAA